VHLPSSMPMEAAMLLASGILDVPQKIFTDFGFAQKISRPRGRLKCDRNVTTSRQPASLLRENVPCGAHPALPSWRRVIFPSSILIFFRGQIASVAPEHPSHHSRHASECRGKSGTGRWPPKVSVAPPSLTPPCQGRHFAGFAPLTLMRIE
jgi:hypothetical protein